MDSDLMAEIIVLLKGKLASIEAAIDAYEYGNISLPDGAPERAHRWSKQLKLFIEDLEAGPCAS